MVITNIANPVMDSNAIMMINLIASHTNNAATAKPAITLFMRDAIFITKLLLKRTKILRLRANKYLIYLYISYFRETRFCPPQTGNRQPVADFLCRHAGNRIPITAPRTGNQIPIADYRGTGNRIPIGYWDRKPPSYFLLGPAIRFRLVIPKPEMEFLLKPETGFLWESVPNNRILVTHFQIGNRNPFSYFPGPIGRRIPVADLRLGPRPAAIYRSRPRPGLRRRPISVPPRRPASGGPVGLRHRSRPPFWDRGRTGPGDSGRPPNPPTPEPGGQNRRNEP